MRTIAVVSTLLLGAAPALTGADEQNQNLVSYQAMTTETALVAAQAALESCRDSGYQVAVAVVDRGGNLQALLRDRFAGPHTPATATGKAYTAVSFRTDTTELVELIEGGELPAGLREVPRVIVLGGGLKIEASGSIVGGIGVSGAPGGDADDACAMAGVDAVQERIEF